MIEAAILATRTHLLSADQIREELDRLRPLIEKTGGETEQTAMGMKLSVGAVRIQLGAHV